MNWLIHGDVLKINSLATIINLFIGHSVSCTDLKSSKKEALLTRLLSMPKIDRTVLLSNFLGIEKVFQRKSRFDSNILAIDELRDMS